MRLQKYMALCGVASRRKAEELILAGKVKVNGKVITELGVKIDEEKDVVFYNGQVIKKDENLVYYMINKPMGVVSTASDEQGRRNVVDLIKTEHRVYPVGRLDIDTSGLLLLTNDGDLTYKLTHPKHEVAKIYVAKIEGTPSDTEMNQFRNGLAIEDYVTSEAKIDIVRKFDDNSIVKIEIHEGKNRQVRKMCEKIGHKVLKLRRIRIGNLSIGELKPGEYRKLTNRELEYLRSL